MLIFTVLITISAIFLSINGHESNGGTPGLGHHHKHHHKHHYKQRNNANPAEIALKSAEITGKLIQTFDGNKKSNALFSADFETNVKEELVEEQRNIGLKRSLTKTVDKKASIKGQMDFNANGDYLQTNDMNAKLTQINTNSKTKKFHKKYLKKHHKREKRDTSGEQTPPPPAVEDRKVGTDSPDRKRNERREKFQKGLQKLEKGVKTFVNNTVHVAGKVVNVIDNAIKGAGQEIGKLFGKKSDPK